MVGQLNPFDDYRWAPFQTGITPRMRSLDTDEGLGDRIRLVAFAERQAYWGFLEAAAKFADAPKGLTEAWTEVALEEKKHEGWLLDRLLELRQNVSEIPVSLNLYHSFGKCTNARDFALYIADAEERGRIGAERFAETLKKRDPKTADVFAKIALEERAHIALVGKFFGEEA